MIRLNRRRNCLVPIVMLGVVLFMNSLADHVNAQYRQYRQYRGVRTYGQPVQSYGQSYRQPQFMRPQYGQVYNQPQVIQTQYGQQVIQQPQYQPTDPQYQNAPVVTNVSQPQPVASPRTVSANGRTFRSNTPVSNSQLSPSDGRRNSTSTEIAQMRNDIDLLKASSNRVGQQLRELKTATGKTAQLPEIQNLLAKQDSIQLKIDAGNKTANEKLTTLDNQLKQIRQMIATSKSGNDQVTQELVQQLRKIVDDIPAIVDQKVNVKFEKNQNAIVKRIVAQLLQESNQQLQVSNDVVSPTAATAAAESEPSQGIELGTAELPVLEPGANTAGSVVENVDPSNQNSSINLDDELAGGDAETPNTESANLEEPVNHSVDLEMADQEINEAMDEQVAEEEDSDGLTSILEIDDESDAEESSADNSELEENEAIESESDDNESVPGESDDESETGSEN